MTADSVEPWLRGTHSELDPVRRAVLHALQLAREDVVRWCLPVATEALELRPLGLPSVAFQLRHMARSLDRLLTYAEGNALTGDQLDALQHETEPGGDATAEFGVAIEDASQRVLRFAPEEMDEPRPVGRSRLATTVAGLLIHIAEHTQRHTGQAITTAKVVAALAEAEAS